MASSDNTSESSGKSGKSFSDSVVEGAGKTCGAALAGGVILGAGALILSGGNPFAAWAAFKTGLGLGAASGTMA